MNSPFPIEQLTDEMSRQIKAERLESSIQMDLEQLLEMNEFARVENIFRKYREKLPRKDAA